MFFNQLECFSAIIGLLYLTIWTDFQNADVSGTVLAVRPIKALLVSALIVFVSFLLGSKTLNASPTRFDISW